jgi:DNA-directed RNA polymerase subunit RPC12/RpoP
MFCLMNTLCGWVWVGVWNKVLEKGSKIVGKDQPKESQMKRKDLRTEWKGQSEEMVEGMAEWREKHPKASLREIEGEVDRRLSELRAKMITDTANHSALAEWDAADGIVCPECGAKLMKKGKQKRVLLTRDGRKIELARG